MNTSKNLILNRTMRCGALMAANVLRSKKANQTSVLIIRAFVALRDAGKQQRQLLDKILARLEEHGSKIGQHDAEISGIVTCRSVS